MSWKVQAIVSERICGSITRKMVLINMAARANDDGTGVYAALPTIAAWSEIDARSVRRVVRQLEEDGLIELVGQRACKTGHVNEWALCLDAIEALPSVKNEIEEQRKIRAQAKQTPDTVSARTESPPGRNVTPDTVSGRTVCPQTPDTVSANSILEPNTPSSEATLPQRPPRGGAADRGSRLPSDWAPDPPLVAYAVEHGYSEHEAAFIAHRFANHWHAATGRNASKRDWRRAFQNWVTNEKRWLIREGAAAWRRAPASEADVWANRERIFEERHVWNPAWGPAPNEPGYLGGATNIVSLATGVNR